MDEPQSPLILFSEQKTLLWLDQELLVHPLLTDIGMWVTWLERPKGAKDKVRMPEGQKTGPKGRKLEVGAQRALRLLVLQYYNITLYEATMLHCNIVPPSPPFPTMLQYYNITLYKDTGLYMQAKMVWRKLF